MWDKEVGALHILLTFALNSRKKLNYPSVRLVYSVSSAASERIHIRMAAVSRHATAARAKERGRLLPRVIMRLSGLVIIQGV